MTIDLFITKKLDEIQELIATQIRTQTFDSHEFIRHFSHEYELDYVSFLSSYDVKPFRTVHSQIALSLSKHAEELNIVKRGKVISTNVFGNEVENEEWKKVN